jgi:hypothetical protein
MNPAVSDNDSHMNTAPVPDFSPDTFRTCIRVCRERYKAAVGSVRAVDTGVRKQGATFHAEEKTGNAADNFVALPEHNLDNTRIHPVRSGQFTRPWGWSYGIQGNETSFSSRDHGFGKDKDVTILKRITAGFFKRSDQTGGNVITGLYQP